MKILVTGANGYIGQGVVRALLDLNQEVIATDFDIAHIDSRAKSVAADIFAIDSPFEYFDKPDALLHLAWRDGFKHDSLNHLGDLYNHYIFLSNMITAGIKQVAVLGSMHEVGFHEGSIDEKTPANPLSLYGISKNSLRQSVELLKRQNDFTYQWIRGFYIVGNVDYGCSIFSKIAQAAKSGQKTFPFTSGENQFDFIDYDEFCYQVASVVTQTSVTGIINCCSGKPMKLSERVEQFIKDNNFDIKLLYGEFPDRPYDSKAIWGNNSKIQKILKEQSNERI
ncbi:MAG: NAD(P)-dependent oxidoreductase [Lachnospiraceae bacterium]|nr:NAD(P)-dependent oxidoreductase [Lachnospiraceae bacterium]